MEREQEKDIQREEREKHTQLIPREEKERHTDNSACLSPAGGKDTGGLRGEWYTLGRWDKVRGGRERQTSGQGGKSTRPPGRKVGGEAHSHQCTGG